MTRLVVSIVTGLAARIGAGQRMSAQAPAQPQLPYWTDQITCRKIAGGDARCLCTDPASPDRATGRLTRAGVLMQERNKTNKIYQNVALELAEKINRGDFADGSRLPSERVLAELFGVSRTSIREALLSLQSSGLITVREKARARVTRLSNPAFFNQLSQSAQSLLAQPHGVENFQEARVLFECGLARYAARYASPKELNRLAVALARNKRAITDPELFAKTDVAFHDALAEIPRNPIVTALNSALAEWLMQQRLIGIRTPIRGAIRSAFQGHQAVFEAVAAHDVEAADKAMADHLKVIAEFYWKAKAIKDR